MSHHSFHNEDTHSSFEFEFNNSDTSMAVTGHADVQDNAYLYRPQEAPVLNPAPMQDCIRNQAHVCDLHHCNKNCARLTHAQVFEYASNVLGLDDLDYLPGV